ncbi:hypothetical protein VTN49DRAFT_1599 [Thermomyces lanuginosus]|uniref:uncharacterized protein n=1 Tax=Thermomyces lanuginosus TaxID=5541 RepID=UPI0037447C90
MQAECRVVAARCRPFADHRVSAGARPSRVGALNPGRIRHYQVTAPLAKRQPVLIYRNSLQKTLERHRQFNRSNLIAKRRDRPRITAQRPSAREETSNVDKSASRPQDDGSNKNKTRKETAKVKSEARSQPPKTEELKSSQHRLSWTVRADRPAQKPWLSLVNGNADQDNGMTRLNAEIESLQRYMTPTPKEVTVTKSILRSIIAVLQAISPETPRLIGSRMANMALGHSTVDVLLPISRSRTGEVDQQTISMVKSALERSTLFDNVHVINEKYLLMKIAHRSGLPVVITSRRKFLESMEFIKLCHEEFPELSPLYTTIRMILESRGLFGSDNSSINPYGLTLLIISFLKLHAQEQQSGPNNLANLLFSLLDTYGNQISLTTTGISAEPAGYFTFASLRQATLNAIQNGNGSEPKHLRGQRALLRFKLHASHRKNQPAAQHLCIQDPVSPLQDVGLSCTRTTELQKAFAEAYTQLREAVDSWDRNDGSLTRDDSILASALRANFDDFEDLRNRIWWYRKAEEMREAGKEPLDDRIVQ